MQIGPHSNNELNFDFDPFAEPNEEEVLIQDSLISSKSEFIPNLAFENFLKAQDIDVNISITKVLFLRIETEKNNSYLEVNELNFKKDLLEIDEAHKSGDLLIETWLSDGQRIQKTSKKASEKIKSMEYLHIRNQNGDVQIIDVQNLNIHIFTSNDLRLLSFIIMAAFAAQEVRKDQDKLNKYQENQIKGNSGLELLLRNISKKNQNEIKDFELPYEIKKAKDKKRIIQKQIILNLLKEMRMEENEKSKHDKNIELIKDELIQFIKLNKLKKISNKISEEKIYQISIIQLIKNLPIVT